MTERKDENLKRAYALQNAEQAEQLYDSWASGYDEDMQAHAYASPARAADVLLNHLRTSSVSKLEILDGGCGTGLVGVHLQARKGSLDIAVDGIDLSPGMLKAAESKHVYRNLAVADLTAPISSKTGAYDAVICVGTLTKGHVGPQVLAEFVRVIKPQGLIVATIHSEIWTSLGFDTETEHLTQLGIVRVVSNEPFGILEAESQGGLMLVLQKL